MSGLVSHKDYVDIKLVSIGSSGMEIIKLLSNSESLEKLNAKYKSYISKFVVSHRIDQKQKTGWLKHCLTVKQSGNNISRLDDLLNVAGYDASVTKISPRTLKEWASEVGIEFKPGRPKK